MAGEVARDDAVDVLAGDESEERAAVAEINGEAVKKVGGIHRRGNDRSSEEYVPIIGVWLERVEESDPLHGITPLGLAGLGIYREVSRPVNGRAYGVGHLGRTVERDFGAGEILIGV